MGRHSSTAGHARGDGHVPGHVPGHSHGHAHGHVHAHGKGTPTGTGRIDTPAQWILTIFLTLCALATVIGAALFWPTGPVTGVSDELNAHFAVPNNQVTARVALTDEGNCQSPSTGRIFDSSPTESLAKAEQQCRRAIVDITSGEYTGKRTLLIIGDQPGDPQLATGDKIRLAQIATHEGGVGYVFADYQRTNLLMIYLGLTALAFILIGGLQGFKSLVGLVATVAGVVIFLVPGILRGSDPMTLALITGGLVLFPVLYFVHGFNWKTSSALAGTLAALGLAAVLADVAIATTRLRGLGEEDMLLINRYLPEVSVTGIMLAGFVIGALGVLNDSTVAQASTVNELYAADPSQSPFALFRSAMVVGRDHISSMIYTLVLSYTGSALPMLLLLSVANRPLMDTLTSDIVATELLRSAVGAVALVLAVPITTGIAALCIGARKQAH